MCERKSTSNETFRRLFISDIYNEGCGESPTSTAKWIKVAILGVVVAVKESADRITYAIDDGTGILDCFIMKNLQVVNIPELGDACDIDETCEKDGIHSLLGKLEQEQKELEEGYNMGDAVVAYGFICIVQDKPRLKILKHNKVKNPNLENSWILNQLHLYQEAYS